MSKQKNTKRRGGTETKQQVFEATGSNAFDSMQDLQDNLQQRELVSLLAKSHSNL